MFKSIHHTVYLMSIRNKLILLFAFLLAAMLAVQAWLFYAYTDDVAEKFGEAAFSISKDTASVFVFNRDSFQKKETFTYRDEGKTVSKTLIIPNTFDIKLRLDDDSKDNTIKILGSQEEFQIPIPRTPLETSFTQLKTRMIWITLSLFGVVIIIVSILTYNMMRPLTALNKTAEKISQGELGAKVLLDQKYSSQEFEKTVNQFNHMSDALVTLTEQQHQQQELEHFKELSDISRGLAHNLRNPLNTLLLSIEQISEKSSDYKRLKKMAMKQVQRIDDWLKSFMLLMEQGLETSSVSGNAIINSAISQIKNDNSVHQITCTKDTDQKIECVEAELVMVIHAILQNAIEACEQEDSILIHLTSVGDSLIFTISDQGSGIDESLKDRIFNPYVTNKTYGTGMGLYLAKRIIKHRYRGDIKVNDNAPKGTVITLIVNSRNPVFNT